MTSVNSSATGALAGKALDAIATVDMDEDATFKYVLVTVTDKDSGESKLIVRGYEDCEYHREFNNDEASHTRSDFISSSSCSPSSLLLLLRLLLPSPKPTSTSPPPSHGGFFFVCHLDSGMCFTCCLKRMFLIRAPSWLKQKGFGVNSAGEAESSMTALPRPFSSTATLWCAQLKPERKGVGRERGGGGVGESGKR